MTTLSTKSFTINGKKQTVETIHLGSNKQALAYKVDGKLIHFNDFWSKKPVEIKQYQQQGW